MIQSKSGNGKGAVAFVTSFRVHGSAPEVVEEQVGPWRRRSKIAILLDGANVIENKVATWGVRVSQEREEEEGGVRIRGEKWDIHGYGPSSQYGDIPDCLSEFRRFSKSCSLSALSFTGMFIGQPFFRIRNRWEENYLNIKSAKCQYIF